MKYNPSVNIVRRLKDYLTFNKIEAILTMELYIDPEIDDEYLTLYVRQKEYSKILMELIEKFEFENGELLEKSHIVINNYRFLIR